MPRIRELTAWDVRFPTSRDLHGSDAMHPDPDYSAAYVRLSADGLPDGFGFTFTIGRGNDIVVAAIRDLAADVVGLDVADVLDDLGGFTRLLTQGTQLRWLGPEKGVVHLAAAAIANAAWDMRAKRDGKPGWKLLADMSPRELVDLVDWRHLTDVLTPDEALEILERQVAGRAERERRLLAEGIAAYTTSPGWYGYSDADLAERCRVAVREGFAGVKLKVGADLVRDVHRVEVARAAIGGDTRLMVDANQVWEVSEAIDAVRSFAPFDLWWVEEPVSPDDILGHAAVRRAVAPVRVATGEHAHNRVIFKQLLQAEALDVVQIDACRVAGPAENVAIMLMAAKFGKVVCPHAGGVGLCEAVQHLAMADFVAIGGDRGDRMIEYASHLHDHFVHPISVVNGRYQAPLSPGFSTELLSASLDAHTFPDGEVWR
jgi:L-fuconate dehydratase